MESVGVLPYAALAVVAILAGPGVVVLLEKHCVQTGAGCCNTVVTRTLYCHTVHGKRSALDLGARRRQASNGGCCQAQKTSRSSRRAQRLSVQRMRSIGLMTEVGGVLARDGAERPFAGDARSLGGLGHVGVWKLEECRLRSVDSAMNSTSCARRTLKPETVEFEVGLEQHLLPLQAGLHAALRPGKPHQNHQGSCWSPSSVMSKAE